MAQHPRRQFLKQATTLSSIGLAAPLALNLSAITRASAQSAGGGYKALVCIYLNGGNDAFNTVLATDSTSWAHYTTQRGARGGSNSIALMPAGTAAAGSAAGSAPERLGGVLPITHSGRAVHADRQFALHPALPQLRTLYQSGRLAVLANVGTLTRPTLKADWSDNRKSKPPKLFSHNDQQSTWLSFRPEGASDGWGGLMGDQLMSGNGQGRSDADAQLIRRSFTCMIPTYSNVWLSGRQVLAYQSGDMHVQGLGSNNQIYGNARLHAAVAAILGKAEANGQTRVSVGNAYAADHQKIAQRALQASAMLGGQLPPLGIAPWSTANVTDPYSDPLLKYISPVNGALTFNPLALQLQMVARLIDTNRTANLGITRQFFCVNLSGFDTHNNQIADHADRMAQLNHAMDYFDRVLGSMPEGNMRSQVTTFTASEFGRTFTNNGDGTDHGWGGHHLIMGGAVNGAEVFGTFPRYSTADTNGTFSSTDQIQNGVLIPTTSVDHYAYTLGRWMGVPANVLVKSDGSGILPNLCQFDSSSYDMGILRA